jgi:hypothetical protein
VWKQTHRKHADPIWMDYVAVATTHDEKIFENWTQSIDVLVTFVRSNQPTNQPTISCTTGRRVLRHLDSFPNQSLKSTGTRYSILPTKF